MLETIDGTPRRLQKTLENMYTGGRAEGYVYKRRPEYFNGNAQDYLSDQIAENKEFELTEEQTEYKLSQENIDKLVKSLEENDLNLLLKYLKDNDLEEFKELLLELLQEDNPDLQKIVFEKNNTKMPECNKTLLMFQKKWKDKRRK